MYVCKWTKLLWYCSLSPILFRGLSSKEKFVSQGIPFTNGRILFPVNEGHPKIAIPPAKILVASMQMVVAMSPCSNQSDN